MTHRSIVRHALAAATFLFIILPAASLHAADIPAPFTYTWKIVFRGAEIGRARSCFVYSEHDGSLFLTESGTRSFSADFGIITIDFSQTTTVVWEPGGGMAAFDSSETVRGNTTRRHAERRADGAVVWKRIAAGGVKERTFLPGDFDYTDADRFMTHLERQADSRALRILSLGRGKVLSMTYRFVGRETIPVGDDQIEVSRVTTDGPGGNGTILVDEHGIPLLLTIEMFMGDFSFIPTDRR